MVTFAVWEPGHWVVRSLGDVCSHESAGAGPLRGWTCGWTCNMLQRLEIREVMGHDGHNAALTFLHLSPFALSLLVHGLERLWKYASFTNCLLSSASGSILQGHFPRFAQGQVANGRSMKIGHGSKERPPPLMLVAQLNNSFAEYWRIRYSSHANSLRSKCLWIVLM